MIAPTYPTDSRPPNIVLVITDDQGYGDVGIHGNPHIRTPYLDRFARESAQFRRFYVCPVCSPTRAGLLTGRWNYRTGVVDTYLGRSLMHPDEVTLAEVLRDAGYATGIFGKWHLGDNYPLRAQDQGFQEVLVNKGGGITQPSDPEGNSYFDPILYRNGRAVRTKGYCTDVITDAAIRFIEKHRRRPFFVYLATVTPHVPLQVAEHYAQPYRDMGLDDTTARVYGMVENIDGNVGRLLRRLDELDLAENTIVVFMGDNGPEQPRYNAGLRGLKGTVYEGGIRVPFFLRWRGVVKPTVITQMAAHVDVLPTLLHLARVKSSRPLELDGVSLVPLLEGEETAVNRERALFFQWHRGDLPEPWRNCCVITGQYKLINGTELYDITKDPAETTDIASEHPDVVAELRSRYEAWFQDVSATRGYDPPRIVVGSRSEPVSVLTRQDWRGPRASWDPIGEGHWEIEVEGAGFYDITVRLWPAHTPGTVHVACGPARLFAPCRKGQRTRRFPSVYLPAGPARLEAWMDFDGKRSGVMYVTVRKRGRANDLR